MAEFKIATGVIDVKVDKKTLGIAAGALSSLSGALSATSQAGQMAGASLALMPGALLGVAAAGGTALVAFKGVGDAFKEGAKAQDKARETGDKYKDALNKLSPAAQALTKELVAQRTAGWEPFQKAVSQATLSGFAGEVRSLAGTYLPVLTKGMTGIGTALNGAGKDFAAFLKQGQSIKDTTTGLDNTRKAVEALRPGLVSSYGAFRDLAVVGSSFLPQLATGFSNASARFADFISNARQTGELQAFIQGGIDKMSQLGRIAGDVGSILGSVFRANNAAGADFLTSLERITDATARWAKSAEGQNTLTKVFTELRATIDELLPGLASAGQFAADFVSKLADSGGLRTAASAATALVQALQPLGGSLGTLIGNVWTNLGNGVKVAAAAIGPLSSGIGGLLGVLGPLPGVILASVVAFKTLGLATASFVAAGTRIAAIAPLLGTYTAGLTGSLAAGSAAAAATSRLGGAISAMGRALPIAGVALVGLGLLYDQFSSKADDSAKAVIAGTQSMSAAIASEYQQIHSNVLFGVSDQQMQADAYANVRGELEKQLSAMGPLEQAQARVKISQQNLNDAILTYGAASPQASTASQVLARDTADLAAKQNTLKGSTQAATDAILAQADAMAGQVNSALAYEQAVARSADAQKAANDAIKSGGANSAEAKSAIVDLAAAYQSQVTAAGAAAEATGGAGAKAQATSLEYLSLDRSTQAGSAAFMKIAGSMDNAGLSAITAAAQMTGLRTEIVTLPDGRTVTVVANAEMGKLDELKNRLDSFRNAPVSITLDANINPATGKIETTAQLANGTTAAIQLTGNPTQANGVITQTVGFANGQTGTMTYRADAKQADGTVRATVTYADGTSADMTFKAVDGPARSTIAGTVAWASRQTPTMVARAMTGAAESNLEYLARTRTAVINVITSQGAIGGPAATRAAHGGATGAFVKPMAAGGVLSRVTPMTGKYATRVPPNTWRVIGDNMRHSELFAPVDGSSRSLNYIKQALADGWPGMSLVPTGASAGGSPASAPRASSAASPGRTITIQNVTINGVIDFRDKSTATRQVVEGLRDALRNIDRSNN